MTSRISEKDFGDLFVERYQAGGLPRLSASSPGPLVPEIEFMQGRPDFVCASYPTRKSSHRKAERIGGLISTTSSASLLSHLKPLAPRSVEYLRAQTGLSNGNFEQIVRKLRSENLIKVKANKNQRLLSAPSLDFGDLFVERYQAGGLPRLSASSPGPLVPEIEFMQGRPDFVCASYPTRKSSHRKAERIGGLISTTSSASLLSHLKPLAPRSVEYLRAQTGLSNGNFEQIVRKLRSENLIKVKANKNQRLLSAPSLPAAEVCVFELKLEKWRRAVFQALQYRVAANRVAIVMPAKLVHRIEPFGDRLRDFGVGVISLDTSSGEFRTIIHPRKNKPLSLRHYYFALGNYLKAVAASY